MSLDEAKTPGGGHGAEEALGHGVEQAAEHAAEHGDDTAGMILHHVVDGDYIDLPFGAKIQLPHWELFGLDMSLTRHLVMMWVACSIVVLLFVLATRGRKLVPGRLQAAVELLVSFVRDEVIFKALGEEDGRKWSGYLLTTFFFILSMNLIGMVPYGATATGNLAVTGALAGMTFVMIHGSGMVRHGPIGHFKNFVPHLPLAMAPIAALLFVIEVMGTVFKSFALCMRLFANMIAGHMVILAFLGLIFIFKAYWAPAMSIPLALFIYMLELLVAFLQAYVFTMLTSLFIGMSLHPEH